MKFYNTDWFMWIALVLFAPVGIILMWKNKRFSKRPASVISVIFGIWFLLCLTALPTDRTPQPASSAESPRISAAQTVNESPLQQQNVNKTIKVHYLDVGQGDCILVQTSEKTMLIDAGNKDDGKTIVSYLKAQGISKLDIVVATHPHEDHIGGMAEIIKALDIGLFVMPNAVHTTTLFENMLTSIEDKKLDVVEARCGLILDLGPNVVVNCIGPTKEYEDLNNASAVIRMEHDNISFLFCGDMQKQAEEEISKRVIRSTVMKIGHHGSDTSTSIAFLDVVKPTYAIISVGKNNNYQHPSVSTLKLLNERNINVYRTDESGTIIATSDGKSVKFSAQPSKYSEPEQTKPDTDSSSQISNSSNSVNSAPSPSSPSNSSSQSSKPAEQTTVTVYVTNTGAKYHSDGCRYLSKSRNAISLDNARKSYDPCSVCNPPK